MIRAFGLPLLRNFADLLRKQRGRSGDHLSYLYLSHGAFRPSLTQARPLQAFTCRSISRLDHAIVSYRRNTHERHTQMNTRKTHRTEQLKSYLTDKPRRRTNHILHPMNRDILLGACKTFCGVVTFFAFVVMCFMIADIAEMYRG